MKHIDMTKLLALLGVGIVVGMLIAPEKGSVIRRKITDLIDDLSDAGRHLTETDTISAGSIYS